VAADPGGDGMSRNAKEWITGILLGIIFSILLAVKVMAAPVSDEDVELIARTVQAEAGNQDFTGKRMVAAVILNRVESKTFPDDVEGVLSQKNQFSTFRYLNSIKATDEDILAVQMEIISRSDAEIMFFRTGRFGTGSAVAKVGDHYFSKLK
jgi:spore germination cell wall hydrolase CwlJ-like protein